VGYFEEPTYDDLGPGASIAISDFNHGNPGIRGGAMLANEFIRLPIQFFGRLPPGTPSWGKGLKDVMRKLYRNTIVVIGPTQEMPAFEARIQADPKVKDRWGIPVARLSGKKHPHTIEIAEYMVGKAEMWLKEAGAVRIWPSPAGSLTVTGGQYQMSTCRMGNDSKTSVVNKYCQIHDVDNVFVIDGSVHVTSGGYNPALTIMAIGYWASDYLVRTWKGTRFRS